jgi:AraC-like DNA-binding protein
MPRLERLEYFSSRPEGLLLFDTYHGACSALPIHRHYEAYASFVLFGAYEEYSVDGRYNFDAGCLVVHPTYHAHGNIFLNGNARIRGIKLSSLNAGGQTFAGRVRNATAFAALLKKRPDRAEELVLDAISERKNSLSHASAPDLAIAAATAWKEGERLSIADAAKAAGVSPEYFARLFKSHYGLSPVAYRAEHRFRNAVRMIAKAPRISAAAHACGYADQSHMGRDFKRRTGGTPRDLLKSTDQICSIGKQC